MEKNFNEFEEEYTPERKKTLGAAGWISLCACALIAFGAAAAGIMHGAPLYPAVQQAEPTPRATAAPGPTPQPTPTASAALPQQGILPEDVAQGSDFVATAIFADGQCIGVLASREAAEEVLEEAIYQFELKINLPGSMVSTITNEVTLLAAASDPQSAAMQSITYEAMLALLTGEDSPLEVATTLSEKRSDIIAHETNVQKDDTLIKGTRIIEAYGSDGESRTVITTQYINGVQQGKSQSQTFEISTRVDSVIREGTIKADNHAEPGKREGQKGPTAGELDFMRPTKSGRISQNYGQLKGVMHLGLDFEADAGDEVLAAEAGKVVCVMERGGYGLVVEIEHEGGFLTRYAHLGQSLVAIGDSVARGDAIALAGSSGNAAKAMLHFELRHNGIAYNPRYYMD